MKSTDESSSRYSPQGKRRIKLAYGSAGDQSKGLLRETWVTNSKTKMTLPKVLVLLAAFNGSKWIVEQIESILNQAGVDLDLLVSDDGSSDDTLAKIARFAHDQRVRVISPPAPTGSAAQNFLWLIRNTSVDGYEFFAFADQDDIWLPGKLRRGCSTLTTRSADGYSCAVTAFWSDGREKTLRQVNVVTASDFMFEGAGQGCTFVLTATFYCRLRAFFLEHGTQTRSLHYHDWAIYALARSWKNEWSFDRRPMLRYRQHPGNDTGARLSLGGVTKRLRLIKGGWYLEQLRAIVQVCALAAPTDATIAEWNSLLNKPRSLTRRYRIARFFLKEGGRRRRSDNIILLGAAVLGWV
ncbi:MAG: glycosyltransferase [Pseudomonadota bacterium]|nr:glycosyltransferase [Pseudomonadota bacterium]